MAKRDYEHLGGGRIDVYLEKEPSFLEKIGELVAKTILMGLALSFWGFIAFCIFKGVVG